MAQAPWRRITVGIIRVDNKCANGECPDRTGNNLKRQIDTGLITEQSKVVSHVMVHKSSTAMKEAIVEMVKHCEVILTLGWDRIRPDDGPRTGGPQWANDMVYKQLQQSETMSVVEGRTLVIHLSDGKHRAEMELRLALPYIFNKVQQIAEDGRRAGPISE